MIFVINEGMGGEGESPGLYITKIGAFPAAEKLSEIRDFIAIESNEGFVSILES